MKLELDKETTENLMTLMQQAAFLDVQTLVFGGFVTKFFPKDTPQSKPEIKEEPKAPTPPMEDQVDTEKLEEIFKMKNPLDEMSAEEILFYATPYYDELQAQKKKRQEDIAEGKLDE